MGVGGGWVGELWLLMSNGNSWFDSRKLGGIVCTSRSELVGFYRKKASVCFAVFFSGFVFAEDEDRDGKQRYSVKKSHVG